MRHASIYQFPDRILVHPSCRTEAGFLVAAEPYVVLAREASPDAVGRAVVEALDSSKRTLPNPADWKAYSAPRHYAAGVKSEIAFQRKAKLVSVAANEKELTLEPTHNGGTKGDTKGFYGKPELKIHLPILAGPAEIGSQVIAAFLQCTGKP